MSQNNSKSPCRAEGDISVLLVLSTNSPKSHKYKSYMIKKTATVKISDSKRV